MQPNLYTVVNPQKLEDMLQTFFDCVGLAISALDTAGQPLTSCGGTCEFCQYFGQYLPPDQSCAQLHAKAGQRAVSIGETYIFSCHAGLSHIVFPLISQKALLGSILVGPFLMEAPDSLLISDIDRHYHLNTEALLELYEASHKIPVILPAKVTRISHLLYYLFSGLIPDSKMELLMNQKKLQQQSLISESIQRYKTSGARSAVDYPYEQEKALITKVKSKDAASAKALLNDLLGYVFFSEGRNLEIIKTRAIELCSLLSRAAIEGGATNNIILKLNNEFVKNLQEVRYLEDLCYKLQEILEAFMDNMFDVIPGKNHEIIKNAIHYISDHFTENITLEDTAASVHLNAAYFSTIFKQSTGSSFKEYVNMVRIEESKRLLSNTGYTILDIAVASGFEDQSYFSKVFKKYTGMTPKQYRQ